MSAYRFSRGKAAGSHGFHRSQVRTKVGILALTAAVALGFAPLAQASSLWGAIAWLSDGTTREFQNYPEMTQVVLAVQAWSRDAKHIRFSSGSCGALAQYTNPFGNINFSTGLGKTRDEATKKALAAPDAYLLDSACQQ